MGNGYENQQAPKGWSEVEAAEDSRNYAEVWSNEGQDQGYETPAHKAMAEAERPRLVTVDREALRSYLEEIGDSSMSLDDHQWSHLLDEVESEVQWAVSDIAQDLAHYFDVDGIDTARLIDDLLTDDGVPF